MNKNDHLQDLNRYKELLEAELKELEQSLSQIAFRDDQNPNDWVPKREDMNINEAESLEVAEEIEAFEENSATVKELETRYNDIKAALERIKNDTFGIDEISGEPISKERLAVNPAARTSVENAPQVEQEATPENNVD